MIDRPCFDIGLCLQHMKLIKTPEKHHHVRKKQIPLLKLFNKKLDWLLKNILQERKKSCQTAIQYNWKYMTCSIFLSGNGVHYEIKVVSVNDCLSIRELRMHLANGISNGRTGLGGQRGNTSQRC